MRNPKNLTFWPQIVEFTVRIYRFAAILLKDEQYNLASQVKRAAVSVRLNLVEGAACESASEFARFLGYSYRSLRESLACLEIAELEMCKSERVQDLLDFGDKLAGAIYAYRRSLG